MASSAILELVNIPLQAWIWFGMVGFPVTFWNGLGFAAFALLLVQGAAYWWAKRQQVVTRQLPGLRWFRLARWLNPVLLVVTTIGLAIAALASPGAPTLPGLGFALFAVLEYVNYFRTQLMYDTMRDLRSFLAHGFRRAHLAADLERGEHQ